MVARQQLRLIAANGLTSGDKVKLVARAIRQNHGFKFLSIYKFPLDSTNGTVYVLVSDENDANLMVGHSWAVGGQRISLYRVLSIGIRPKEEDFYQSVDIARLFPTLGVQCILQVSYQSEEGNYKLFLM